MASKVWVPQGRERQQEPGAGDGGGEAPAGVLQEPVAVLVA